MKPASIIYIDDNGHYNVLKQIIAYGTVLKFFKDSKGRVILKHVTA